LALTTAPACSHEQSGSEQPAKQPEGTIHCTDCVQADYLKASGDTLDCLPLVAVLAACPSLSQPVALSILPAVRLVPHESPPSIHPVLRI